LWVQMLSTQSQSGAAHQCAGQRQTTCMVHESLPLQRWTGTKVRGAIALLVTKSPKVPQSVMAVCQSCPNKGHTGGYTSRHLFPHGSGHWFLLRPLSSVGIWLPSPCCFTVFLGVCVLISSYKDASRDRLSHFTLITPLKALSPGHSHSLKYRWLRRRNSACHSTCVCLCLAPTRNQFGNE
jgi:hypothetical protein